MPSSASRFWLASLMARSTCPPHDAAAVGVTLARRARGSRARAGGGVQRTASVSRPLPWAMVRVSVVPEFLTATVSAPLFSMLNTTTTSWPRGFRGIPSSSTRPSSRLSRAIGRAPSYTCIYVLLKYHLPPRGALLPHARALRGEGLDVSN